MVTSPRPVEPAARVLALDHLVLTVSDLERTRRLYVDVLGMTARPYGEARFALHFGDHKINVHDTAALRPPVARRPTPGSADICLLVQGPLSDIIAGLTGWGIPIESGPVERTGAAGPLGSLYIRDPDGNLIELSVRLGCESDDPSDDSSPLGRDTR